MGKQLSKVSIPKGTAAKIDFSSAMPDIDRAMKTQNKISGYVFQDKPQSLVARTEEVVWLFSRQFWHYEFEQVNQFLVA